jgi:hypothetical protein
MEQTLTTFNFHLDTKVTTWYRTEFEIKANSMEEAKQLAIGFHLEMGTTELPWEHIDETLERIMPDENGGEPTEELYDEEGNIIWDNTKSI